MVTITIQIGNTDDKLSQSEWADYVSEVREIVTRHSNVVYFFGASANWERWQNAAWVIEFDRRRIRMLKTLLLRTRKRFSQDSVAWSEGETQFI